MPSNATPTLTPRGYRQRIAEANVARILRTARALLIEGPKGCGKTWLAKRFSSVLSWVSVEDIW